MQTTADPSKVGRVEFVILGVKAWQVEDAAREISSMISENMCVLPLQNGVEAADQLTAILGDEHALGTAKVLNKLDAVPITYFIRQLVTAAMLALELDSENLMIWSQRKSWSRKARRSLLDICWLAVS